MAKTDAGQATAHNSGSEVCGALATRALRVSRTLPIPFGWRTGIELFLAFFLGAMAACQIEAATTNVVLLDFEGTVEINRAGARADRWDPAGKLQPLDEGDRGRTGEKSRA